MKKKILAFSLILMALPLASCGETQWSWWEENNITIEKYISMKDAMAALDSSSKNFSLATSRTSRGTYNTYYKEYLGKFSTETDNDIKASSSSTAKKYSNDIVFTHSVSDMERSYLNAKSVSSATNDTYLVPQSDKSILSRSITDYGYGEKVGSDSTIPYTGDDAYLTSLSIGATLSSSFITWEKATYGFSKNDEVIIETMSTTTGSYTVTFNSKSLTTFVTNTYRLYRLKEVGLNEDGSKSYMMDYSYSKVESLIGSNVFDEPLNEPFLLEKTESSSSYDTANNGAFDLATLPTL